MVFTFNIGVPKVVKVETHSLKICDGVGWLRGVQQRFWILRFKRSFMSSSIGTTIIHFLQYRFSEWPPSYSSSLFSTVPVQVKILLYKKSLQNPSVETKSITTSAECRVAGVVVVGEYWIGYLVVKFQMRLHHQHTN